MAEQYDNKNRFVLFKNDKDKETQPDYTGTITLADGSEKRLSAWLKESKAGVTYISGTMSEPWNGPKTNNQSSQEVPAAKVEDMKDDIPF